MVGTDVVGGTAGVVGVGGVEGVSVNGVTVVGTGVVGVIGVDGVSVGGVTVVGTGVVAAGHIILGRGLNPISHTTEASPQASKHTRRRPSPIADTIPREGPPSLKVAAATPSTWREFRELPLDKTSSVDIVFPSFQIRAISIPVVDLTESFNLVDHLEHNQSGKNLFTS